jgi:hypothetical protein
MPYTRNCDGGFGNVGGNNYFAGLVRGGLKDAILLVEGESSVKRKY